jgi:hypothetical protein
MSMEEMGALRLIQHAVSRMTCEKWRVLLLLIGRKITNRQ